MLFNRKEEYKFLLNKRRGEIEARDIELLENRDKKRYILIKVKSRTITTEFGNLTFDRHIYKHYIKKKWKYIALIDEELKLKKWSKLDLNLVELIKEQLGTGKRYRDIIDMFPEAKLSLMTISRIFKSIKNEDKRNKVERKISLVDKQRVYIFVDDAFVNVDRFKNKYKWRKLKINKDTQIRVVSFCTGFDIKTIHKKRRKLKDKRTTFFIGKDEKLTTEKLAIRIYELGCNFYDNFENAKLVVGGDGAIWIKELASFIGANYILDRFHAVREFRKLFLFNGKYHGKELFRIAINLFYSGNYKELIQLLEIEAPKEVFKYFKNNRIGIINQSAEWNIGVSAESEVSRLVKSALGYGSKVYSLIVLKNMLNERAYKLNNNLIF
ncbi:Mbov_0401 family ICE element transposase-like protein [Spiroplasma endosymbiont of Atherix ibis]|uniref:Mbov_0401 family ICE element transposase-like protein n=1 Tax=Spiroplasma endosymbiont of Atherix ibis TaxID=3066291 RepID=UPI0030CD4925